MLAGQHIAHKEDLTLVPRNADSVACSTLDFDDDLVPNSQTLVCHVLTIGGRWYRVDRVALRNAIYSIPGNTVLKFEETIGTAVKQKGRTDKALKNAAGSLGEVMSRLLRLLASP